VVTPRLIADRFELDYVLGRGGMSEVWLAHDRELEREVAVKILVPPATSIRFGREARTAASLSHPNIVGVFDSGEVDGRPYLVLEYLPGGTLEDVLSAAGEAPLPDEETSRIARDVAAGLAYAHEQGVVHRDLKPSNVLFDAEGRAKIADFRIARAATDSTLTPPGVLAGTVQYMAPEQAAGESVGQASDVYSFGVVLFEMLTGRAPFEADGPIEAAVRRSVQPAPLVESYRPDAPAGLAALAASTLAPDPSERPADGNALLRALAGETASVPPSTAITEPLSPVPVPRRRRYLVLVLALGLAAFGGLTASLLLTGETADAPAVPEPAAPGRTGQAGTTVGRGATAPSAETPTTEDAETAEGPATAPSTPATETSVTSAPTTTAPATTETAPATTAPTTTVP
jgi:eukaryotic-like serine/threonine-protein kinase